MKTCGAAAATDATDSAAATCKAGYYLNTATPAACTRCPAGFFCPDGTGLIATIQPCTDNKTSIDIAAGYAGTVADCSAFATAPAAAILAWCQGFKDVTTCVNAKPGWVTIPIGTGAGTATEPTKCIDNANCKSCTDATFATCVAKDGYA